ncbi:hypothetical protein BD413DRAFT_134966 [Trametes elegans]|nr:hypothetical protein BD413DRAFT_134966 [Trametes elegans]
MENFAQAESDNPPWYAYRPDGKIQLGGVPERIMNHPVIKERGIALTDSVQPGVVFRSSLSDPVEVVKVLNLSTQELPIYERLVQDMQSPMNHTVPSIWSALPYKGPAFGKLMTIFQDMIEGVVYLHSLNIAHLDICTGNVLAAHSGAPSGCYKLVHGRVYIIDFDSARQLELGPGVQGAITLPETQMEPPDGLQHFDPYSWDVYCLGHVCADLIEAAYRDHEEEVPWLVQWYARWLIGKERGCTGVCHCRPTARRALQVLSFVRTSLATT